MLGKVRNESIASMCAASQFCTMGMCATMVLDYCKASAHTHRQDGVGVGADGPEADTLSIL